MDRPAIIPIYPPEVVNNPKLKKKLADASVETPVTIEHTLVPCPRCGRDGWIGPKQRLAATFGNGKVLCVICIFQIYGRSPELEFRTLNRSIDDVPRRNG